MQFGFEKQERFEAENKKQEMNETQRSRAIMTGTEKLDQECSMKEVGAEWK